MPASLLAVTKLGKLAGLHAFVTPVAVNFSITIIITGSQISQSSYHIFAGFASCILHLLSLIVMDVLDLE